MNRNIDDVVQALRRAKGKGMGATLLIGAGCSVKAGIPLAGGFVDEIGKRFPLDFARAKEKTYAHCMRELLYGDRRDLIAAYVDNARVNWAHVCIAALMKAGYVDRVLTTNFDNLVVRACALLGEFPAVYDLAVSRVFNAADIPAKAVFYLHGQHTGFVLRNTPEEVAEQSETLGPVFDNNGLRRTYVVVGYSGLNDPVFEHLAAVPRFDYGLYWVGYEDEEPAEHIRNRLLSSDKHAFYLGGYNADSFFVTLAQKLGVFPPQFVGDPFNYLQGVLETLTPYTLPGENVEKDVTLDARERIKQALEIESAAAGSPDSDAATVHTAGEEEHSPVHSRIVTEFMAGNYENVTALARSAEDGLTGATEELVVWAHLRLGNSFLAQAQSKTGDEADQLFAAAVAKYEEAVRLNSDQHAALNNWGNSLSAWARRKEDEEADRLYADAVEKYREALRIKPDKSEALYNWGLALSDWAKRKAGEEADRLFARAEDAFRRAEAIVPGRAAYNLGCLFALKRDEDQAREWLELSWDLGYLPNRAHLLADPDLENVRETAWFQALLADAAD